MAYWTLYARNRTPAGTITVDANPGANASYPVVNVGDRVRQTPWVGSTTTSGYVKIDTGGTHDIGAIAFANHNLGSITAALTIQHDSDSGYASPTTVTPTNGWSSPISIADDADFLLTFTSSSERYWRIYFDSLGAVPRVGEIALLGAATNEVVTFNASCPRYPVGRAFRRGVSVQETAGGIFHITNRGITTDAHVAAAYQDPRRFSLSFSYVDGTAATSIREALRGLCVTTEGFPHPMWLTTHEWDGSDGTGAYHVIMAPGDFDEQLHAPINRNQFNLEFWTAI